MNIGTTNTQLKKFINLLKVCFNNQTSFLSLLNSLLTILSNESSHDVFLFTGKPSSGMRIENSKMLSKKGICFTTSILIEQEATNEQTIFKLTASKDNILRLSILKGYLHYRVKCGIIQIGKK